MKVSIIGSNGFLAGSIGSYCNKLNYDVQSWGITEEKSFYCSAFHKIDLLNNSIDYENLSHSDIVIYAAGAGIQSNLNENYEAIYQLNTLVPIRLFRELNASNYHGHIVTFGSYFEYGKNQRDIFFTEKDIISSINPVPNDYCISKRLLTRFISSIDSAVRSYHFILPTIYGESENPKRLLPFIINAVKNNEDLKFTAGNQIRQYLYVDDIPSIIFKVIENNIELGIYNIAGEDNYEIRELVHFVLNHLSHPNMAAQFGQTDKPDTGMKILKLNDKLLKSKIDLNAKTKIGDVIKKYVQS